MTTSSLLGPGLYLKPGPATVVFRGGTAVLLVPGAKAAVIEAAWDAAGEGLEPEALFQRIVTAYALRSESSLPPVIIVAADHSDVQMLVRGKSPVAAYTGGDVVVGFGGSELYDLQSLHDTTRVAWGSLPKEDGVGQLRLTEGIGRADGFTWMLPAAAELGDEERGALARLVAEHGDSIEPLAPDWEQKQQRKRKLQEAAEKRKQERERAEADAQATNEAAAPRSAAASAPAAAAPVATSAPRTTPAAAEPGTGQPDRPSIASLLLGGATKEPTRETRQASEAPVQDDAVPSPEPPASEARAPEARAPEGPAPEPASPEVPAPEARAPEPPSPAPPAPSSPREADPTSSPVTASEPLPERSVGTTGTGLPRGIDALFARSPTTEKTQESAPEPEPEPDAEPVAVGEPEPVPEPVVERDPEPVPEPMVERKPVAEPDAEPAPEPVAEAQPTVEPAADALPQQTPESQSSPEQEPLPESGPAPVPEPQSAPGRHAAPGRHSAPIPGPQHAPEPESLPEQQPLPEAGPVPQQSDVPEPEPRPAPVADPPPSPAHEPSPVSEPGDRNPQEAEPTPPAVVDEAQHGAPGPDLDATLDASAYDGDFARAASPSSAEVPSADRSEDELFGDTVMVPAASSETSGPVAPVAPEDPGSGPEAAPPWAAPPAHAASPSPQRPDPPAAPWTAPPAAPGTPSAAAPAVQPQQWSQPESVPPPATPAGAQGVPPQGAPSEGPGPHGADQRPAPSPAPEAADHPRSPARDRATGFISWVPGMNDAQTQAPAAPSQRSSPAAGGAPWPAPSGPSGAAAPVAGTASAAPAQPGYPGGAGPASAEPGPTATPAQLPTVPALLCPSGHANPQERRNCYVCGAGLAGHVQIVPRPTLGQVNLSTGGGFPLDRGAVIGRRPRADRVQGHDVPRLVPVPSPNLDVSRSHLELRLEGWHVVALDLHSTNETVVFRPGSQPWRLRPGEGVLLRSGDALDLGDGVVLRFEGLPG